MIVAVLPDLEHSMQGIDDLFQQRIQHHFGNSRATYANLQLCFDGNAARITGQVLDRDDAAALIDDLRTHAPQIDWQDTTTSLIGGPQHHWAMISRSVVDVRRKPDDHAERVTQAIWGEPCEVLHVEDDWAFIRASDGYLGWMHTEPLQSCADTSIEEWLNSATHVVQAPLAPVYATADLQPAQQCMLLPFGIRLQVEASHSRAARVRWLDGSERWIASKCLIPLDNVSPQSIDGLRLIAGWLPPLLGVPYLWGGKSPFGYDCSGLVQTIYELIGMQLPRDADQQYTAGDQVSLDQIQLGDLLFFDTDTPTAKLPSQPTSVTHVAFALQRNRFIHSSRRHGGVVWGSLDPASPYFVPELKQRLVGARRYGVKA